MRTTALGLASHLIQLGVSDHDHEIQRLRKSTTNIIALVVTAFAPF
jgi:hypothetical protein